MQSTGDFAHATWYYLTHLFSGPAADWGILEWFLVNMVIFVPLAFIFAGVKGQKPWRRGTGWDAVYWFGGPFLYGPIGQNIALFFFSLGAIKYLQNHGQLSHLPILLQAFLILLLTDFLQYWAHRAFHGRALWGFHAIHHSSRDLDWLSASRFHPINIILYSTTINALIYTIGFSMDAFLILVPFNAIYSPLVHANLNWTYGPFRYVLSSPVFHRWHHTHPDEGGNKNFAPTFPFIDLMFGTFYMPKGVQPSKFGTVEDDVPEHLWGQIVYPFRGLVPKKSEENQNSTVISVEAGIHLEDHAAPDGASAGSPLSPG